MQGNERQILPRENAVPAVIVIQSNLIMYMHHFWNKVETPPHLP